MKTDLNVLIVDDSDDDAVLVMRELTREFNAIYERVDSSAGMSVALGRRKWDVVICDYIIPGFSVFAALEILKKNDLDIPLIVVSGKVEEDIVIEVMKAGACDYVLKDKLGKLRSVVKREMLELLSRQINKATQEKLRESDARYRDICENTCDMMCVTDDMGKILYHNPAFGKKTGYQPDELKNMNIKNIVHRDHVELWHDIVRKVISNRVTQNIVITLNSKNGQKVYVEGDCGIWIDSTGKVNTRVLFHDVTEIRMSQMSLGKYEAIVNTTTDFMSMVNSAYVYEAVNDAYCAAQAMERNEIVGKTVAEMWGKKVFNERVKDKIDKCFEGNVVKYREYIEFPVGGERFHDVSLYPYKEEGAVTCVIIVTRDITEIAEAEEKRKQYVDNLAFLSNTAMSFLELPPDKDIFKHIALYLKELLPDAIILTCKYNKSEASMKVASLLGVEKHLDKITAVIGSDFLDNSYEIDEESRTMLMKGTLNKQAEGLYDLSYGKIPKVSCKIIERLFGVSEIYSIGFSQNAELYGDAKLILKRDISQDQKAIVEVFIKQVSVALLRRKAENDLVESEERMRVLFDCSPDAYALCDTAGCILDCNRMFCSLTELGKEMALGSHILSALNIKNSIDASDGRMVWNSEKEITGEYLIVDGKGKEKIVELTKIKLKSRYIKNAAENSKPVSILAVVRDITERKRFVEEIRKLAKFVYENPEPMMRVSKEGKLVYANPASMDILNAMHFEIDSSVTGDWLEIVKEVLTANMKKNVQIGVNNKIYVFEVVPLAEAGYVNLYGRDVTESERSAKALRDSEEKYRKLFEESKDMVSISTPQGEFIDVNPAGIEMLGYSSKEELLRLDLKKDIYYEKDGRIKMLEQINKYNYIKDYETTIKRKDGKLLTVILSASVVRDSKDNIMEIRAILKDVTERKAMEMKIAQLQKMESLGMLAGGIAHDFNNLLTGIIGNVSYLKNKAGERDELRDDILGIEESAKNAAGLTGQLLAFARGGQYNVSVMDINEIVERTKKIISRSFADSKIKIHTETAKGLPGIEADSVQIGQVVMNLCVNAKDAMRKGGLLTILTGEIFISDNDINAYIEAKPGRYVYLSIKDTGVGMDKNTSDRIFEPFFTTKTIGSGTGLGMSVVYGIVKNHGGFIKVESSPGVGTSITAYIPASNKQLNTSDDTKVENIRGNGETVLVVDDEKEIRLLVKRILEGNNYTVLTAQNGNEALKVFTKSANDISLVVIDMLMPNTDSEEVLGKMMKVNKDVKVLISTGYSQSEKTQNMLKKGCMGVLQKPFNMAALLSNVRNAIDTKIC